MSGPVFATRWDFLLATVLIGVDRSTGVYSGSETVPGQQMVCVWTRREIAEEALHVESWDLRPIEVRDLVAMLPPGIGVVVDPERPSGMTASAAYVSALRPLLDPFPPDVAILVGSWDELAGDVLDAVRATMSGPAAVRDLVAFTYRVDDSPPLGCLAFAADDPAPATAALRAATASVVDPGALGVAAIRIVPTGVVPAEVLTAVGDTFRVAPPRRRGRWRR
ncbi:hypothetical protein [Aeromicrobium stalagmiti]|uniref:hypothetical protein n=1 Tax=Aeromicrobium stalagmiti TaxID=2738988 RepID=UPI0015681AB9|nr:hypothetical protein [Aeromicrobium stalagmiti]NRQ50174.1 hypothetical protein [Aeromicrobium stalagmiti]